CSAARLALLRAVKLEAVVSIGFSYGDDDTHARRATEVQWWSDQSLCHVAVNEMRGAGPSSDRIESSVPSAVLQVLRWRRAFSDSALYGAGGYPSSTRMSWLRGPPIMLVIGAWGRPILLPAALQFS